jgi:hypothetical protein
MKEQTQPARKPIVGEFVRGIGTLVEIQEVPPPPPPPPRIDYVFETRCARTELRVKGRLIKELQTLNDHYGLGTGLETSIEEAKAKIADYGATPDSDIELVVIEVRERYRKRLGDNRDPNFYDRSFVRLEDLAGGIWESRKDLPEPVETLVWTSKRPDQVAPTDQTKS